MSQTLKSVRATVSPEGKVTLAEPLALKTTTIAMLTVVLEDNTDDAIEPALLSEDALAKDWGKPEEDEAWAYLQEVI